MNVLHQKSPNELGDYLNKGYFSYVNTDLSRYKINYKC